VSPASAAGKGVTAGRRKRAGRRRPDPIKPWARRLKASRPGLVEFVLENVASLYGEPTWKRVLDPLSELVLVILTQNTADINAEKAFDALRLAYGSDPSSSDARSEPGQPVKMEAYRPGWGGRGWAALQPPDWARVEGAPIEELSDVIRPAGLVNQKAPRIQAALTRIREQRGEYSLEFLGQMEPLEARDWLTSIDGIGVKTASVVLMMAFGMPLMPVDRHVERVSKRIGLIPAKVTAVDAHDRYLALLEPRQCYPMHVGLITHGRRMCVAGAPRCDACPIAPRCRHVDRQAP
jgi:endonuclease III